MSQYSGANGCAFGSGRGNYFITGDPVQGNKRVDAPAEMSHDIEAQRLSAIDIILYIF